MENKTNVYNHNYYIKNKDRLAKYKKEYHIKNYISKIIPLTQEELNNKYIKKQINQKKYNKHYSRNKRMEVVKKLGSVCVKCGFSDIRALQIDHINGGGSKERKNNSNSGSYYYKILNNKNLFKEYQLLCANCNWIKRYENKEC